MAEWRRHTPDQIIAKLREAQLKLAKVAAIGQACKDLAATESMYHRWRREYGGMEE